MSALDRLVSAFLPPMWLLLARFANRVGRMIEESVDIRHEREELKLQQASPHKYSSTRASPPANPS